MSRKNETKDFSQLGLGLDPLMVVRLLSNCDWIAWLNLKVLIDERSIGHESFNHAGEFPLFFISLPSACRIMDPEMITWRWACLYVVP
jgi:hypothetical protein